MVISHADKITLTLISQLECYQTLSKIKEFKSIEVDSKVLGYILRNMN